MSWKTASHSSTWSGPTILEGLSRCRARSRPRFRVTEETGLGALINVTAVAGGGAGESATCQASTSELPRFSIVARQYGRQIIPGKGEPSSSEIAVEVFIISALYPIRAAASTSVTMFLTPAKVVGRKRHRRTSTGADQESDQGTEVGQSTGPRTEPKELAPTSEGSNEGATRFASRAWLCRC